MLSRLAAISLLNIPVIPRTSPPFFYWSDIPPETKSFVLICNDPDAPFKTWVHWVIFNIPKEKTDLKVAIPRVGVLPQDPVQGRNDFGRMGYGGHCPPPRKPPRYFFKLYV